MNPPLPIGQTKHLNVKISIRKNMEHSEWPEYCSEWLEHKVSFRKGQELERCIEPDQEGPFYTKINLNSTQEQWKKSLQSFKLVKEFAWQTLFLPSLTSAVVGSLVWADSLERVQPQIWHTSRSCISTFCLGDFPTTKIVTRSVKMHHHHPTS